MEGRRNGEDSIQQFDEILGECQEEAELPDGSEISFHWLKENTEEEVVRRSGMIIQNRVGDVEGNDIKVDVLQQWGEPLEVLNTFEQKYVATEISKNVYILMTEKDIQTQVFQQRDKFDDEIGELWKLMQRNFKRRSCRKKKIVSLRKQLIVQICISKAYGNLQIKIWDPGGLRIKSYMIQKSWFLLKQIRMVMSEEATRKRLNQNSFKKPLNVRSYSMI